MINLIIFEFNFIDKPLSKTKYWLFIDSEQVPWGNDEKYLKMGVK